MKDNLKEYLTDIDNIISNEKNTNLSQIINNASICFQFTNVIDSNYLTRIKRRDDLAFKNNLPYYEKLNKELKWTDREINRFEGRIQDTLKEIQKDVDEIKVQMKENIKKQVDSMEDVNKLEEKSANLKMQTADYANNANTLKKVTWWQNCKLTIIIAVIIIAIVLAIVLPIVLKK